MVGRWGKGGVWRAGSVLVWICGGGLGRDAQPDARGIKAMVNRRDCTQLIKAFIVRKDTYTGSSKLAHQWPS